METMQQLRNAHRLATLSKRIETKGDGKKVKTVTRISNITLKAFAEQNGVAGIITRAHQAANKPRSPEKKERTRAASTAKKTKKDKKSSTVTK